MNVTAWDGAAWQKLGTGFNGAVDDVDVYKGDLIAGGEFTSAGATNASRIARWDGVAWHALGAGIADGRVYDLATFDGDLIVAGAFGSPALAIARWDGAGGSFPNAPSQYWAARWDGPSIGWTLLGDPGRGGLALAVTVYRAELVIGGDFALDLPSGTTLRVARGSGSAWQNVGTGLHSSSSASALGEYAGDLIVGGEFGAAGGVVSPFLARWGCIGLPCPGDVNRDARVDAADLDSVLAGFGTHPPPGTSGDVDQNGVVDQADVDIVLFGFGVTCP